MKYRALLIVLKSLIYTKRALWLLGNRLVYFVGVKIGGRIWLSLNYVGYKFRYLLKRLGWRGPGAKVFRRDYLQVALLIIIFFLVIPHTNAYTKKDPLSGQKTIAYAMFASEEDFSLEEVTAQPTSAPVLPSTWKEGAVASDYGSNLAVDMIVREQDLGGILAGGSAVSKPTILPGTQISGTRDQVVEYKVEPGDSLSSIAYQFGLSVATVMWSNNLTLRSLIQPGQALKIPPTSGVMHTVKKGDNIKKIAILYDAKQEDIIKFNKLDEDGSDLKIGEVLMVPGGVKPQERIIASTPRTATAFNQRAVPPGSRQVAGVSGFVWPSGAHTITQYYGAIHHALDIAGPFKTPNYAAKAGTVIKSQCGWNSGYGCYIIIDHGNGVKTLYGHHAQLLVSVGDHVEAGQTIGLMGNTGKVRGRTGIHLHFEIQINGVRVNPLGYVR